MGQHQQPDQPHQQQRGEASKGESVKNNLNEFLGGNTNIIFNLPKIGRLVPTEAAKEQVESKGENSQTSIGGGGNNSSSSGEGTSSASATSPVYKTSFTAQFLGCKEVNGSEANV